MVTVKTFDSSWDLEKYLKQCLESYYPKQWVLKDCILTHNGQVYTFIHP